MRKIGIVYCPWLLYIWQVTGNLVSVLLGTLDYRGLYITTVLSGHVIGAL